MSLGVVKVQRRVQVVVLKQTTRNVLKQSICSHTVNIFNKA